jgi:hypothetical protein
MLTTNSKLESNIMTSIDKKNDTTGIKTEKTEVVKNVGVDATKQMHSHTENVKDSVVAKFDKVDGVKHAGETEKNIPQMDKNKENIGVRKVEAKSANVEIKTPKEDVSANKDVHSKRN